MDFHLRNKILVCLIFLSLLPSLLFVDAAEFQGDRVTVAFAKVSGVVGIILLAWVLLMGIRTIITKITHDLGYVIKVHKVIGKYSTFIILFHPIFYVEYYNRSKFYLLQFDLGNNYSRGILYGFLAIILIGVIFITSITFRRKLKFRPWHLIHLLTYVIVPLVLIHAVIVGSNTQAKPMWYIMTLIYAILMVYQMLFKYGFFRKTYKVVEFITEADNSFTLFIEPEGRGISRPIPGQYVHLKHPLIHETHPFSISGIDGRRISITIKDLGQFTHLLETIQIGDQISLDGPYGVFLREVSNHPGPFVFIAGGIGITPFMPVIRMLMKEGKKKIFLFYGNREEKDVAFLKELENLSSESLNLKVVHILEQTEENKYEKGYLTNEILSKYLKDDLAKFDYFIVGPPPMMNAVKGNLNRAGVPKDRQYFELFN